MAPKRIHTLTGELINEINNDPDRFEARLTENTKSLTLSPTTFTQSAIARSGMTLPELIKRSGLSKGFVYQIFSGERKPGRDSLLRIALAARLPLEEVQRLLALWQRPPLYPRVRRDAALMLCMKRSLSLMEASEYLQSIGEQPLL